MFGDNDIDDESLLFGNPNALSLDILNGEGFDFISHDITPPHESQQQQKIKAKSSSKKKKRKSSEKISIFDVDDENEDEEKAVIDKKSTKLKKHDHDASEADTAKFSDFEDELDWELEKHKKGAKRRHSASDKTSTVKKKKKTTQKKKKKKQKKATSDNDDSDNNNDDDEFEFDDEEERIEERKKRKQQLEKEKWLQKRREEKLSETRKKRRNHDGGGEDDDDESGNVDSQRKKRQRLEIENDVELVRLDDDLSQIRVEASDLMHVPNFSECMEVIRKTQSSVMQSRMKDSEYQKKIEEIQKEQIVLSESENEEEHDNRGVSNDSLSSSYASSSSSVPTSSQSASQASTTENSSSTNDGIERITLKLRCGPDDEGIKMKVPKTIEFHKMYAHIAKVKNVPVTKVSLLFDNMVLGHNETPEDQDMEDGDLIDYKIKK